MIELELALDYAVREGDRAAKGPFDTNFKVSDFLIREAVEAKYPSPKPAMQGPTGIKEKKDRKIWGRILNALTRSVIAQQTDPEATKVTLDGTQIEWIKSVLDEWSVPHGVAPWYTDLDAYLTLKLEEAERAKTDRKNGAAVEKPKHEKVS